MQDGELLWGYEAIAVELSRITGQVITEKQAGHLARRQAYRTKRIGRRVTATKTSLGEDCSPESVIAAIAS